MEEVLERLLRIAGVEGALVVGKDGLVISHVGRFVPDPDSFGASIAEVLNSFEAFLQSRGACLKFTLTQSYGVTQLTAINEVTFLVIQAQQGVNIGRLRYDTDQVASLLQEQL